MNLKQVERENRKVEKEKFVWLILLGNEDQVDVVLFEIERHFDVRRFSID